MSRKIRKRKRRKTKVELSQSSPFSGMKFPEGSRRVAFMAYCDSSGNMRATRRALLDAGQRAPSIKTLNHWADENSWATLRLMVDDGILEYLDAEEDPDIKDAIKEEAGLFKFLIRLRSTLYAQLSAKESLLMPANTNDLVRLLKHIEDVSVPMQKRIQDAVDRVAGKGIVLTGDTSLPGDHQTILTLPDNVQSIAKILRDRGEPVTESNIAREFLTIKEQQQ